MWNKIKTEYAENAAENEHLLTSKFFELKFHPDQTIMSFIAIVEQMAAQLRELKAPVSETQMMAKIIMSLPASYRHFLSAWDSVPSKEKTMNLLTKRLIKEEKLNKIFNQKESLSIDSAFIAGNKFKPMFENYDEYKSNGYRGRGYYHGRGMFRGRGGYLSRPSGNRSWIICNYCNIPGHVISQCRKRFRNEKHENHTNSNNVHLKKII